MEKLLPHKHILEFPDSGLTFIFYEHTERVVMITYGGQEAFTYTL